MFLSSHSVRILIRESEAGEGGEFVEAIVLLMTSSFESCNVVIGTIVDEVVVKEASWGGGSNVGSILPSSNSIGWIAEIEFEFGKESLVLLFSSNSTGWIGCSWKILLTGESSFGWWTLRPPWDCYYVVFVDAIVRYVVYCLKS